MSSRYNRSPYLYNQPALFDEQGMPTVEALPVHDGRPAVPDHVIDGTSPYIEQTGGERTYAAMTPLDGPSAEALAKQGLGGRRALRAVAAYQDAQRAGTADMSPRLTDDQVLRAHQAYKRASAALAQQYADNLLQEPQPPRVDSTGFEIYNTGRRNPVPAMIRARNETAQRRRAAMPRQPKNPNA